MNDSTVKITGKRRRGQMIFFISVAVMAVALVVVLFLLRITEKEVPTRKPEFDPQACIRMMDISRVYRIKGDGPNPQKLWFATAEGVRVLDLETFEWIRYGLDHGL
ncbi:MAG: hypothetical protein GF401_04210, partial [Chitinivibrionales bacterium]|nr:hypothetical protein [Chitinivibrionales bacterium]